MYDLQQFFSYAYAYDTKSQGNLAASAKYDSLTLFGDCWI